MTGQDWELSSMTLKAGWCSFKHYLFSVPFCSSKAQKRSSLLKYLWSFNRSAIPNSFWVPWKMSLYNPAETCCASWKQFVSFHILNSCGSRATVAPVTTSRRDSPHCMLYENVWSQEYADKGNNISESSGCLSNKLKFCLFLQIIAVTWTFCSCYTINWKFTVLPTKDVKEIIFKW